MAAQPKEATRHQCGLNRSNRENRELLLLISKADEKESLAKKLGAHHYIDAKVQEPVAALQALGCARLILAKAANSKSMSPLLGGLAPRGQPRKLSHRRQPKTVSFW